MARIQVPKKGIFTCDRSTVKEAVEHLRQVSLGAGGSTVRGTRLDFWLLNLVSFNSFYVYTNNQFEQPIMKNMLNLLIMFTSFYIFSDLLIN